MNGKRLLVLVKIIIAVIIGFLISYAMENNYIYFILGFGIVFGFMDMLTIATNCMNTVANMGATFLGMFGGGLGYAVGTIIGMIIGFVLGALWGSVLGVFNAVTEIVGAIFMTNTEQYKVHASEQEDNNKQSFYEEQDVYFYDVQQGIIHMGDGKDYVIHGDTNIVTGPDGKVCYYEPEENRIYQTNGPTIQLDPKKGYARFE